MTPSPLMSPRVTFWRTPSPPHVGDVLSEWPLMVQYKLFFTAIKISERHDILYETIGYLPEEQTSYEQVWIIAHYSYKVIFCVMIIWLFEIAAVLQTIVSNSALVS